MTEHALSLPEQILLLALRDEEGTIAPGTMYTFALGGAILSELVMNERLAIEGEPKKLRVVVRSSTRTGDALLDECLDRVGESKKPRSPSHWVTTFANTRDLKHRLAERLVRLGILRETEGKILWIFPRTTYPEQNPRPEQELLARIEDAVFGDTPELDPRLAVLISLADSASVLRVVFDKKRLKAASDRLERIAEGSLTTDATQAAIEAMQAAMVVTAVIPAVVATTVITS